MNYERNLKAFLRDFPLGDMSGHQKFIAVAALSCKGEKNAKVATKDVKEQWPRSLLRAKYNPAFYDRAQQEGWVDPVISKKGIFTVTETGLDHLAALLPLEGAVSAGELKRAGSLIIVNRKATHTFDKFLRKVLAEAKAQVLVGDSWVDGTIFDNVLDVIPKTVTVKLLYAQARDNFEQRSKRFSTEYEKFAVRRYKPLHDRFMIVDDVGYVLGPSIKDAASNSPALVVMLDVKEKRLLQNFFDELWKKGRTIT